jgi:hypothetical protein
MPKTALQLATNQVTKGTLSFSLDASRHPPHHGAAAAEAVAVAVAAFMLVPRQPHQEQDRTMMMTESQPDKQTERLEQRRN